MKRILIIANKSWEVEPVINVLLNKKFTKKKSIRFFNYKTIKLS